MRLLPLVAVILGLGSPSSAGPVTTTIEAWGHHYRLNTDRGAVHVWAPKGYDPATAGTVIYLHGYYTDADQAWEEANLAEQFEASGRNALFIVPESPNSSNQAVQWSSLDTLLEITRVWTPVRPAQGPLVVVGHSGAFRTIVEWLQDSKVMDVVLLDGLYQNQRDFYWWLQRAPGHAYHRLTLVAVETLRNAERFVRRFGRVPVRSEVPAEFAQFTPGETRSRVLLIKSRYEHMALVNSGKVIPVLLHLPPLPPIHLPATTTAGRP
jgi:hypothetical protein